MRVMISQLQRKLRRRRCPHCNQISSSVARRRMSTQYANDEQNYITCCLMCFFDVQLHWKDMWEEYWASRM